MQIASSLAGFSLTQADHLRRAMSKKNPQEMDRMRKDFVSGCHQTSKISEGLANKLFDLIDYFSGYGFNRSHSAAYALISYRTAYLKANFPVEFMCALLTSEKDDTDKVVEYVKESEAMGIQVLPPDVNESLAEFNVIDGKTTRFGLLAVKNVGSLAIESIVKNRISEGKFKSLFDFCERVDLRLVNRKVIESLIKCGAFDCFKIYRAQMVSLLDRALELGARSQKEKSTGQMSIFNMMDSPEHRYQKEFQEMSQVKEWPQAQILSFEKELLGFYVSGHPLGHYLAEMKQFTDYSTKDLVKATEGQEVKLFGLISNVKLTTTKKTNERMAILKVEDMEGEVEVVVFPSTYQQIAPQIRENIVSIIKGRVSFRDDSPKIIANDIRQVDDAYKTVTAISIDLSGVNEDGLRKLKEKLALFPGKVPVYLRLDTNSYKSVQILVGQDLFVAPSDILMNELKEVVGQGKFSLTL